MSATIDPIAPHEAPPGARFVEDLVDIGLASGDAFAQGVPHDAFDTLRAAGGVAWHHEGRPDPRLSGGLFQLVESPGFWVVTSHELVEQVLRNQPIYSSRLGTTFMPSLAPESLDTFRTMMLNMDPPEHLRLRRILQPIFTPKAVERLRESVALNAREIVAAVPADETFDLVTAVSAEMPLLVLADLLGMPREDRRLVFEWSNALLGFDNPDAGTHAEQAMTAIGEMMAYGLEMAAARRSEPRDDIVSMIVNASVDGERLTDEEFQMFWLLLVVAGNETTRNALSGSVVALHEHDRWGWLAQHLDALPTAIEELLRYVSPVMHFRRTATQDVVLGDQHIRAGDKVIVWFGAANRDPGVFDRPHELDLERDPNPHLAFGVGPHFCLGAHLARLEIYEMLRQLLAQAPDLTLDGDVQHVASNFIAGLSRVPVKTSKEALA